MVRPGAIFRLQYWIPLVRLKPVESFPKRLISKIIWIFKRALLNTESLLGFIGAKVTGKSELGNVFLCFRKSCSIADKGRVILIPKDYIIFDSVRFTGKWEIQSCEFLAEAFNKVEVDKKIASVLLDIGANSGMNTLQVARLARNPIAAVCVEPLPLNLEALEYNLNNCDKIAEYKILPYALGAQVSRSSIYEDPTNSGNSSLLDLNLKNQLVTEIEVESTMNFISGLNNSGEMFALKIDTQGYEVEIISDFSPDFWSKIVRAVIEVRAQEGLSEDQVGGILESISLFDTRHWGGEDSANLTMVEIRNFWLSGTYEERDLYLSNNRKAS